MNCEGDKYCKRGAEYKIITKKEGGRMVEYKELFLCGICLISQYIESKGLKKEVEKVIRL